MRDGVLTVIRPIKGSPAERAGVLAGDQRVAVDGWFTQGKHLDDVLKRIRGKRGTTERLNTHRPGVDQPISLSIVRGEVHTRSVVGQRLDGDVAYIIIKQFQRGTCFEFLQVLGNMRIASDAALEGLILDLRTNPGGLVHEAVLIADEILEDGVIVSTRARRRVLDEVRATFGGAASRLPLAVLVNDLTASAAELVAGAIQDHERGVIVGATTYGKGSVQSMEEELRTRPCVDRTRRCAKGSGLDHRFQHDTSVFDHDTEVDLFALVGITQLADGSTQAFGEGCLGDAGDRLVALLFGADEFRVDLLHALLRNARSLRFVCGSWWNGCAL